MVETSRPIDLHALTLNELNGVVTLYPWFSVARMELCRRMAALGDGAWSQEEFAEQSLYMADRGKFGDLMREKRQADYSDKDAEALLEKHMETSAPVRVVGGDYFSQAQYDKVRDGGDSIFSRMAVQMHTEPVAPVEEEGEIAEHFATETLARIFVEQGRFEEAKRIYSRLILDIPEKSAYFASLIEKLNSQD